MHLFRVLAAADRDTEVRHRPRGARLSALRARAQCRGAISSGAGTRGRLVMSATCLAYHESSWNVQSDSAMGLAVADRVLSTTRTTVIIFTV